MEVVAHITEFNLKKAKKSGMSTCIPQYVLEMQKLGYGAFLITISDENKKENINGIDVYYCKDKNFFADIILKEKVTACFFHSVYCLLYYKLYDFLVKSKVPYYIVTHGGLSKYALKKDFKKIIFKFLLLNRFVKKSKAICFHCKEEQEHSGYTKKDFYILKNYFDYENPTSIKKNLSKDSFVIVALGRIDVYYKGIDVFLKSVNLIKDFLREKKVVIKYYGYGYPKTIKYFKNFADKKNINDIIMMCGEIYGDDKFQEIANANIFLQTSRSEGFSLSIGDALYVSTPIFVTEGVNVSELVNNTNCGWLTKLNKYDIAENLKNAIIEMQKNETYYIENSKKAYNFLLDENISQELNKIFQKNLE